MLNVSPQGIIASRYTPPPGKFLPPFFSVATLFEFVARFARVRIEDSSRNRGEFSGRGIFREGNIPGGEYSGRGISGRGIFQEGNIPGGEYSGRGIFRSPNNRKGSNLIT